MFVSRLVCLSRLVGFRDVVVGMGAHPCCGVATAVLPSSASGYDRAPEALKDEIVSLACCAACWLWAVVE